MSKRKMTVEYLREMVKKSFSNVDIDEGGKMCVLPFQSLVDTVDFYEDKLAWQEVEIQQLTEENAGLKEQVDELKSENTELYKEHTTLIAGSILEKQNTVKDTAKEIFETIFYDCWAVKDEKGHKIFDEGKIKDFAKKCYGVEVE